MRKVLIVVCLFYSIFEINLNAQQCLTNNSCSNFFNQFPTTTLTPTTSWTTRGGMNGGNWTLFNVTAGNTYEWTYCESAGGISTNWDAQLTLYSYPAGTLLCYSDNQCGTSGNAPYIRWLANTTGTVRLLTSKFNCTSNAPNPPFNTLAYRLIGPSTYNFTVTVFNVTGATRSNATVKLYSSTWSPLQTLTTNSSGQVTFPGLANASYNYEVYYKPSGTSPPLSNNDEFWGSGTVTINGASVSQSFTRIQPYISLDPGFSPSSVDIGIATTGTFPVRNALPYSQNSYVEIWVDRSQTSSWDYHSSASPRSLTSGSTSNFLFTVIPGNTGSYKYYAFVYSNVNNNYIITDQYAWTTAFTATCAPLSIPTSPTPGSTSGPGPTISSLTPTLSWSGSSAGIYHVQIWNASTNPTTSANVIYGFETPISSPGHCISGLSHAIPAGVLSDNSQYKWSVHRNEPCGECESSSTLLMYFQTNTNPCTAPTTQVSNITFNSASTDRFTLQWNNGNGTKRIIKLNTSNSFANPINGSDPSSNSTFQNTGEQVVYNGSGSTHSVLITGLSPNTTYWARGYEANCSNATIIFNTNVASNNPNNGSTTSILPPNPDFTTTNGIIIAGQSTSIFDNSSSSTTSWNWIIRREEWNGNTTIVYSSSSRNISFNFPQPACYRVALTATNSAGSNTLTRQCYIYAKPDLNAPIPVDVTRSQKYYSYHGGDPVNVADGSFSFSMRDFSIPGVKTKLTLERRYLSNSTDESIFGTGWYHSFDIRINFSNPLDWIAQYPDGHNEHFAPYSGGETRSLYPGNFDTLVYTASGGNPTGFTITRKDGIIWNFNGSGQIVSIVDLDANQTIFSYSAGKLVNVTLPGGRFLQLAYNAFNKVASVTDNINRTVYYYYDATGHNLDSTRISNATTGFRYGPYGMTEVYDPRGNRIILNVYNSQGQVYEQYDADNKKTAFQYNVSLPGETIVTDPLSKIRTIKHDSKSRCIEIKNELNQITKYGFSLNNTLDTITDARNFQTVTLHDSKGNLIKSINAKNFSDTIGYTTYNKPNYIRDKEGNITTTLYSATGNPTDITVATGDVVKIEYDNRGLDTAVTDARGFKTKKIYNLQGDLIQVITPTSLTTNSYDAVGRLVEIIDSYGRKDSLFWNHFDQLIKRRDKMGRIEEFGYDENGNQIFYKDKKGQITITEFNKHDKPIRIIEPQNHVTEYVYDDNQRITKKRDANRNTLIFSYDDAGREIQVADSILGNLFQKAYDAAGNILTYTDGINKTWTNQIDEIGRITVTTDPLNNFIQYRYNKNNLPIERIDEEGKSVKWEYDARSRHITTIDAKNNTVQRFLNKNGFLDSVRDSRGNIRNKATYDGSNRVLTLNDGFGNYSTVWDSSGNIKTTTDPDGRQRSFFYNSNNELLDIKSGGNTLRHYVLDNNGDYSDANARFQNATVIRNQLGWITHYTDNYANTFQHIYDSAGNTKKLIYPGGKVVEYKYNSLNKCIEVKDWTDRIFTIGRNNNGNITSIQYPNGFKTEITRNDLSRISAWINKTNSDSNFQSNLLNTTKAGDIVRDSGVTTLSYTPIPINSFGTYGKDDRMITYGNAACTTNASGQRIYLAAPGRQYFYVWSAMSELDSTIQNGTIQSMQYDAFNERVTKKSPQKTMRYIVDHYLTSFPLVLQERDNNNLELLNYLYIPDEGILLASDSAGTLRFYHHNSRGNTIALSDVTAQITDRYEYGEFGDTVYHAGGSTQAFTWMGMYGVQHDGNGLYYLHARYYDGTTNTFVSQDQNSINYLNTPDINRYVYGYNNPLRYIDPTGMIAQNNISYDKPVFSSLLGTKDKVFTIDQFLRGNQDQSFISIILQRNLQYGIVPGGPEIRYVINPIDNSIMDMRHVMVIGFLAGTNFGNILEAGQLLFNKSSALNPMDYYSNKIGKEFREFLNDHPTINTQNDWAMIFYLWIKGKYTD